MLQVWRSIRGRPKKYRIGIEQFHLLLRSLVVGSGNIDTLKELIQYPADQEQLSLDSKRVTCNDNQTPNVNEHKLLSRVGSEATSNSDVRQDGTGVMFPTDGSSTVKDITPTTCETISDILDPRCKIPADVDIKNISTPVQRLMLLGNVNALVVLLLSTFRERVITNYVIVLLCECTLSTKPRM